MVNNILGLIIWVAGCFFLLTIILYIFDKPGIETFAKTNSKSYVSSIVYEPGNRNAVPVVLDRIAVALERLVEIQEKQLKEQTK
jgi:hypothetical protein